MLLFARFLLLAIGPMAASAQSWTYYDIRDPRNQFVLERKPDRSAWMDIGGSAEFCGGNDLLLCFKAGEFQFAVPKGFSGQQSEWTYDGISYKVSGANRRYILGQKYTTYSIERDLDSKRLRFLYSPESGLIAITTVGVNQGMLLILSEKCGYGAPAHCYQTKSKLRVRSKEPGSN